MRLPVVLAADLSFLLLGDWGGSEDGSTSGERDTSKGMEKVASALESSFVLALGDNFYPAGVTSKTEKKRFKSTYEDVYTGKCLQNTWYAIAGNHDHSGDVKSQIEYSDGRWHFPSLYYTFNKTLDNGKTAEFVMFDSVVLSGLSYRDDETGEFVAAPGPADAQAAEDQWGAYKEDSWGDQSGNAKWEETPAASSPPAQPAAAAPANADDWGDAGDKWDASPNSSPAKAAQPEAPAAPAASGAAATWGASGAKDEWADSKKDEWADSKKDEWADWKKDEWAGSKKDEWAGWSNWDSNGGQSKNEWGNGNW